MSRIDMNCTLLALGLANAVAEDEKDSTDGFDMSAGMFGSTVSQWLRGIATDLQGPIDMVLHCPKCGEQHIDEPQTHQPEGVDVALVWTNPPHRTHLCHSCGYRWRPADVATNGVAAVKTRGKDDDSIVTPSVLRIAASDVFQALEKASHGMYVDDAVPYALVEALGKALRGVK